jgi:hypothetical protein
VDKRRQKYGERLACPEAALSSPEQSDSSLIMLMKPLKALGSGVLVLFILAIVLYIFVVNFSAVDSRFECSGKISSNGGTHPVTSYFKLEEYSTKYLPLRKS